MRAAFFGYLSGSPAVFRSTVGLVPPVCDDAVRAAAI